MGMKTLEVRLGRFVIRLRKRRPKSDLGIRATQLLRREASRHEDANFVDIGVRFGYSSEAMLAGAGGGRSRVFGIDVDGSNVPTKLLKRPNYKLQLSDSVTAGLTWNESAPVSMMFIDGIHTREQVLSELWAWWPHLAENATVAFHDTHWPDDLHEAFDGVVQRRVVDAVLDLLGTKYLEDDDNDRYTVVTVPESFGTTIVRLKSKRGFFPGVHDWEEILLARDRIVDRFQSTDLQVQLGVVNPIRAQFQNPSRRVS